MTSLLPPRPRRVGLESSLLSSGEPGRRRPLVATPVLGGLGAASGTLIGCMALGLVGWFLSDAGAHGTPSDSLRIGALGWLMGHGSGVHVGGAVVTAIPLGLTLFFAWSVWRIGLRVGDAISGHGPDLDALADGERDLIVPLATGLFTTAYVVVAVMVSTFASSAEVSPSTAAVVVWSVTLCAVAGGTGIAVGSGRAASWLGRVPPLVRVIAATARSLVLAWLLTSAVVLLIAFIVDFDTAVNVMSQLHTDAGAATLYSALTLLALPNAILLSSAYLLGPGFAFGVGTVVSPTAVSLGPLPMFPLLAAMPNSPVPSWSPVVLALGPLVAIWVIARWQVRVPTQRWDHGLLRGTVAGVAAGLVIGIFTLVAGGAVGPGRMTDVGASAVDVAGHAIAFFGLTGLVTGAAMTWWQRRSSRP